MNAAAQPSFHPDQFLLSEYSAGNLAAAVALPLAVHLEWCAACRRELAELEALGSQLFACLDPVPVAGDGLARALARIDEQTDFARSPHARRQDVESSLPRVLARFVPQGLAALQWNRAGTALRTAQLCFGDDVREVSLHHIPAGRKVPEHDHLGNEYTVVLRGGFADHAGSYVPGDFIARAPGDVHRPVAASDSDCLCLAVLDAPVRLTGLLGRVINPFLRLHPR